jgi:MFS family permease
MSGAPAGIGAGPAPAALVPPEPAAVDRAIRLTYVQMMLAAIFGASTGGMFLVGFAMKLGADDVWLGFMSTAPLFFVVAQFLAAWRIERGASRRRITVACAFAAPLCWLLIACIPLAGERLSATARLGVLVGIIVLAAAANEFGNNARQSWIGDLIPEARRGRFFGYCIFFAGLVGAVFALVEGWLLDKVSGYGLAAFSGLFFFGVLFGLGAAALNVPQPDCPLPAAEGPRPGFLGILRGMLSNRPLIMLVLVNTAWALSRIAGPFGPAYCLRDVGMSFFGLGLLNALVTAVLLVSAPFWGRMTDRYGCRPVLILGLLLLVPVGFVWVFVPPGAVARAYWILPWSNVVSGVGHAAVGVALAALLYKFTRPEGRAVQLAAFAAFVTLVSAPMPFLGGWLVTRLRAAGTGIDLRLTFYLWGAFVFLAAVLARFLKEEKSVPTRHLALRHVPEQLWQVVERFAPAWLPIGAPAGAVEERPGEPGEKTEG